MIILFSIAIVSIAFFLYMKTEMDSREQQTELDRNLLKIRNWVCYYSSNLHGWFEDKGVPTIAGVKFEEITDAGLTITTKEGKRETLEADTVVISLPLQPNTELSNSLQGKVAEIYQIGDCREPNLIVHAIDDGSRIARDI